MTINVKHFTVYLDKIFIFHEEKERLVRKMTVFRKYKAIKNFLIYTETNESPGIESF